MSRLITEVDLLAAYLNILPEVEQALTGLSTLTGTAGSDELVSSPPRKLRSRLPRSIIAKIVADYQAGSSSRAVAAKYNLPKSSVLVILKQEGVVRASERLSDEQIEAASQLIAAGSSVSIAASELDIAVRSLYHQLKLRGLPTRQ
jgi:transcriptional accessory protein Tex/SPT6